MAHSSIHLARSKLDRRPGRRLSACKVITLRTLSQGEHPQSAPEQLRSQSCRSIWTHWTSRTWRLSLKIASRLRKTLVGPLSTAPRAPGACLRSATPSQRTLRTTLIISTDWLRTTVVSILSWRSYSRTSFSGASSLTAYLSGWCTKPLSRWNQNATLRTKHLR